MKTTYPIGLGVVVAGLLTAGILSQIPSAVADQEEDASGLVTRVVVIEKSLPVGTIVMNASTTPPPDWVICDGRDLPISSHQELFNAIRTSYGGNGTSNFKVPALSNRMPVGAGSSHPLASQGGTATINLTVAQLPQHTHSGTTDRAAPMAYRMTHGAGPGKGANHTVGHLAGPPFTDLNDQDYLGSNHVHNFRTNGGDGCEGAAFSIMPPFVSVNFIIKVR